MMAAVAALAVAGGAAAGGSEGQGQGQEEEGQRQPRLAAAGGPMPPLAAAGGAAAGGPMPPNATVVEVVGLRPRYLPGISDKDTADAGGDIFFWLKDRILHPMHCRRSPGWGQCASGPLLYEDNVYTLTRVATTMPWGPYHSCNPLPSDPSGRTWSCNYHHGGSGHHRPSRPPPPAELNMGRASIVHFGHGQFPGDIYAPALSQLLSNATSGFWYSNLHEGDCDNPNRTSCRWKVLETVVRIPSPQAQPASQAAARFLLSAQPAACRHLGRVAALALSEVSASRCRRMRRASTIASRRLCSVGATLASATAAWRSVATGPATAGSTACAAASCTGLPPALFSLP